jgi:hypothetical protein
MDGRVQLPVNEYLRRRFGVEYVDTITEAGPNGVLARLDNMSLLESIDVRLDISINGHGSVALAVAGHHDCAGNPGPEEKQHADVKTAVNYLHARYPWLPIEGLYIGSDWKVEVVVSVEPTEKPPTS